MCLMNSNITESLNRPDLAHIWRVLGNISLIMNLHCSLSPLYTLQYELIQNMTVGEQFKMSSHKVFDFEENNK